MRSSLVSPALLLLVISPAVLLPVGEVPQPPAGPFTRSLQDDESQATNGTAAPEQDSGDEEQTPTQAQSNTTRPANDTDSPQDGNKQRTNQFEQEGLDSCEDDDDCENTFHCDDRKRCVRCCTKKDKCPDGFFCGGGKCRRCREDGAECHQFDQCCSRSCTNGICGTSGTSCEGDGECGEGEICVADQCVEEPSVCLAVGDPCPFGNAQCCSRNCGGETCVCAADGALCSTDVGKDGCCGLCNNGVCERAILTATSAPKTVQCALPTARVDARLTASVPKSFQSVRPTASAAVRAMRTVPAPPFHCVTSTLANVSNA
uniref:Uncharacterized protein n=1 Tax=Vitrella brassicaformis TaxID=1169539 RepID=A0A7S1K343_9ALVE|mmetsp:Transcript_34906/g.86664  ORF Transcript_34906/g.86664 Transcript_34906/m.86664 type:complete len:317 (+) Transcript_34906:259-1209(+)